MDEPYQWYATVTDTTDRTTTGPTWSFSTQTNLPPVAVGEAYSVDEDEDNVLTIPAPGVLGNDSDPEGDPLTVESVTQGANSKPTGIADPSSLPGFATAAASGQLPPSELIDLVLDDSDGGSSRDRILEAWDGDLDVDLLAKAAGET